MSQPGSADALGERAVEVDARMDERGVVGLVPLGAETGDRLRGGQPCQLLAAFDHDDRQAGAGQEESVAGARDPAADDDNVRRRRKGVHPFPAPSGVPGGRSAKPSRQNGSRSGGAASFQMNVRRTTSESR